VSNIENEDPGQTTPPNDQEQQNVPANLGKKLGRTPQLFEDRLTGRMLTVLDEIRYINDRIRLNTQSMSDYFDRHMQELRTTQGIKNETDRREETLGGREQVSRERRKAERLATEDELIGERHRETFRQQRGALLSPLLSETERLEALRGVNRSFVTPEGGLKIGQTTVDPGDVSQVFAALRGPTGDERIDRLAQTFGAQLENVLVRNIAKDVTPKELAAWRGIEKVASGEAVITPGRILGHVGAHHGLGGMLGGGARRPTRTGRGETTDIYDDIDGVPGPDPAQDRTMGGMAAGMLTRGMASRYGAVRGLAGIGGRLLGGAGIAAAIPGIGEALIAVELLRNFGRNIPIIGPGFVAARQMFGPQALQAGQLTGEGRVAGFQARLDAARLTPGGVATGLPFIGGMAATVGGILHPFDPITNEIANQIVTSVRTQGFTGDRARDLYQGIADIYRDLGVSIETTTQMITEATRAGGESLQQIVTEMHGFDDAAHDLSMNVNEYAQAVLNVSSQFRAGGAGPQATAAAQQFVAGAPRILREGGGLQAYQGAFERAAPQIAAQLGMPVQYLQLQQNVPQTLATFEDMVTREIARMPGNTPAERYANAGRFGLILRGMGVDQIQALADRIAQGRGPRGQIAMDTIREQYNTQIRGLRGHERVSLADMSDEQRGQLGIVRTMKLVHGREQTHFLNLATGKMVDADRQYRVMRDVPSGMDHLDEQAKYEAQRRDIREATLERLRSHLTRRQTRQLEKDIRERSDEFAKHLQSFTRARGPARDTIQTPFGEIRIRLSSNAKKLIRVEAHQNAYRAGFTPPNRSFPLEDLRYDPQMNGG
jgi:hypothetical protein